jgi:hypothetical protein
MRAHWFVVAVTLLAACSYPKQTSTTAMNWEKTSDLAPPLEQARQDCKTQVLAKTSKAGQTGGAYVGGEFVECMQAAGWSLVER